MPIYAYKCSACGYAHDTLQKMSDPPLTVCPECGQSTYSKQVTAAGFQLKGSGWYVTDFRNNGSAGGTTAPAVGGDKSGGAAGDKSSEKSTDKPAATESAKPAGESAKPAAAPASSSNTGGSSSGPAST
ncbi:FmdB family zinc ribbon protein [Schauerella aestuarii]|uniref:FmdB family zinc ribbon protein n=1 Tax=Schauerella aestuarii TaxID=2511204 RepID=UPI00136F54C5|nr:FmdB family zinc ribbon protein [Achromobacter aestuarii]MYZ43648.1 zinc ribbon domain-containing protein [Achromobacter aestuarii]